MKIGFLITARLKSSRLKLKLLKPLHGRNVMERVIDRAKEVVECDEIILCTSKSNQDLPLIRIAKKNDIYYFNGDSEDVLTRLLDAAKLFNLDYIVGITADNPLFSIYHANLLSDQIRTDPTIDFIFTSGMPIGVNMYAIKTKALETVCEFKEEIDTEIWGYLLNRPEIFNVVEVPVDPEFVFKDAPRITLDYMTDYVFFNRVFKNFNSSQVIDILDVYELLTLSPEIAEINRKNVQLDLDERVKGRINEFYLNNKSMILAVKSRIYK